jgi:fructose/tagatose bisphosphate aldolase
MSLVTGRGPVLRQYAEAAARGWTLPCFGTENLTTSEACLAAAQDLAERRGWPRIPLILALTITYAHRPQAVLYTHSRAWDTGLRLALADIQVLTRPDGPYPRVDCMLHLDHAQHDSDRVLLEDWDLSAFSSVMYDASTLPLAGNIAATTRFVERRGGELVIEGACDEIVDAGGAEDSPLSSVAQAEAFAATGVDLMVANLGTEHRASAASLRYRGEIARQISAAVGRRLVLHGASSVGAEQVAGLFADGVVKCNLWTALERDTSPALLSELVRRSGRAAGTATARRLQAEGLLGPASAVDEAAALAHCTTAARQEIVFTGMKAIATRYLEQWYRASEQKAA